MHRLTRAAVHRARALCVAATCVVAGASARAAWTAPSGPAVTVTPLDGAPAKGGLESIGPDGVRVEGRDAAFPLDRVREVAFEGRAFPVDPVPASAPRVRASLRGGEVVRGAFVGGSSDWIEVQGPDLPRVRIPFDAILRVEAESARKGVCDDPARRLPRRRGTDLAYVKSGDAFPGTWVSASDEGVVLEAGGKRTTVAWADLVLLHVDEEPLPPANGLVTEVETLHGSRLPSTAAKTDGGNLALTTRSGLSIALPLASVMTVRPSGGAFVYASDLPFTSTLASWYGDVADPANAMVAKWHGATVDARPSGCPLRVAGITYRHGLGVHSKSRVEIPLGKGYVRFDARLGIDDEALEAPEGNRGDVTARVLVDGKEAWSSKGSVKGGEPARVVGPVDVSGADTLVLEVDFGGNLHVMDRADWCDPVLVRKGS
jgi:hypothetical protein